MAEQRQKGKVFTDLDEIFEHNTKQSTWLLIDNKVYDVTNFKHPGGKQILMQNAGMDATTQFEDIGHSDKAFEIMKEIYVGDFKPDLGEDSGKQGILEKGQSSSDDMMSKIFLVLGFLMLMGVLYTQLA